MSLAYTAEEIPTEPLFRILEPDEFVEPKPDPSAIPPQVRKLHRHIRDFGGYISDNAGMIPNYAERRRYGEPVSTAFVESTVNQVVSKRFAKKQQMQWTPRGVHLLIQLRTRTLDGTLGADFKRWRAERKTQHRQAKEAA